jgi:hypothetical protein
LYLGGFHQERSLGNGTGRGRLTSARCGSEKCDHQRTGR